VVLDGLDEARLHSGERNFDAFLDSLINRFREAGERPSLLILGRPLAASYTANRLFDANISFEWYEIDYFDRGSAEGFIENYLDQGDHKPHRGNKRDDFDVARNTLFDWLKASVPEGVDPKSLSGYAPVLLFVARLLDIGNPHAQVQRLERQADRGLPAAPLTKIASGLLQRDMTKVVEEMRDDDPLKNAYKIAAVWTPEEQCVRLLAKRSGYELELRPPSGLPDNLRSEYEEKVEGWLGDHPFNEHPLFEDYVYAWLLSGNAVEKGLAGAVREFLKSERAEYRPTPLLFWFVAHASAQHSPSEQVSIDAADFGFVYESVLADAASAGASGLLKGNYPKLTLSSQDVGRPIFGEIRFPASNETDEKTGGRKVRLDLQSAGTTLWFWRNLLGANISVASAVRIGTGATDFVLGPDVDLECDEFACDAPTVRVTTPSESERVVLVAKQYLGDAVPEVSSGRGGTLHLRVGWQPLRYPWNRFPLPKSRDPRVTGEIREAFLKLRRLLMLFQAKGFPDLARSIELVENPAFAGSGLAHDLLDYCLEQKLIRKSGGFYELSRQALDDRSISWDDVPGGRISPSIASFLGDFLAWRGRQRGRK
jgi:hypothetical protein